MSHTATETKKNGHRELRDGYVFGLAKEIQAQWKTLKKTGKEKDNEDREDENPEEDTDGEGSLYDESEEEKLKSKRRKTETKKPSPRPAKPGNSLALSGIILPRTGDKSVAGEPFGKLSSKQKKIVAENVDKKTKKVNLLP